MLSIGYFSQPFYLSILLQTKKANPLSQIPQQASFLNTNIL